MSQSADLKVVREHLETKRKEFLDGVARARAKGAVEAEVGAPDIADRASSAFQREFSFFLSENESHILHLIEEALVRLDSGRYGSCINCQETIEEARLQAIPWARHCIACQELQDRGEL
ncbi:MAG: TraR/DksA family transcriptional regulator [Acidobacteriota bacterium]